MLTMTILNIVMILAIRLPQYMQEVEEDVDPVDFLKIDKALIYFNVVTFVSMIGVSLTLFFTIFFFRKIRADFDVKCQCESFLNDVNVINNQKSEFKRLDIVLKWWIATVIFCSVIITLRFLYALPYIRSISENDRARFDRRIKNADDRIYTPAFNAISMNVELNDLVEYLFHTVALGVWQIPYIFIMWPKMHMLIKLKNDREDRRRKTKLMQEKQQNARNSQAFVGSESDFMS